MQAALDFWQKAREDPESYCRPFLNEYEWVVTEMKLALRAKSGIHSVQCIFDASRSRGQSVVVSRPESPRQSWVYAHLSLDPAIRVGAWLPLGSSLGCAAASSRACPGHLHISLIETAVPEDTAAFAGFDWRTVHASSALRFLPVTISQGFRLSKGTVTVCQPVAGPGARSGSDAALTTESS